VCSSDLEIKASFLIQRQVVRVCHIRNRRAAVTVLDAGSCLTLPSNEIPFRSVVCRGTVFLSSRYSNRLQAGNTFLSIPKHPNRLWGPLSLQWVLGLLSLGVKRPGREADCLPPSSAEVKYGGAIPQLPNKSSLRSASLIKHTDNFVSTS
jgi:hypothetical protein